MLPRLSNYKWNRLTAAHLANRAGFGATPEKIVSLTGYKLDEIVDVMLDIPPDAWMLTPPDWVDENSADRVDRRALQKLSEEERKKRQKEIRRESRDDITDLRGWWLDRMLTTPHPLLEKLTLFWHGHFATSIEKVRNPYAMYLQNRTLRQHAAGNWKDMLLAISRDPAMLIYLDNAQSNKNSPNENYARELMELFTLGEGNYTEEDVRASARAFTGWSLDRETLEFMYRPGLHDDGKKKFMGRSGRLDGEDIIDKIVKHPESAPFICRKMWSYFAYENPEKEIVNGLARTFVQNKYEWKPVLREIFTSKAFYSGKALRTQIKSPVQWLVSTCRYLKIPMPDPGISSVMIQTLGQTLFAPPSVKGWDGGYAWITTASLIERYNLAGILVKGSDRKSQRRLFRGTPYRSLVDPSHLLDWDQIASNDDAIKDLLWRFFHGPLRERDIVTLRAYFGDLPQYDFWNDDDVLNLVHLLMSTPLYQLT